MERSEHGKMTFNKTNAGSGSIVTLTVAPDSGYVLDTQTVTDSQGNEIRLAAQSGGKYTSRTIRRSPVMGGRKRCGQWLRRWTA